MEFRDLKRQFQHIEKEINKNIDDVIMNANFIMGNQVRELEKELADYVGVRHCITCGNGTDALQLALMVWNIQPGDAVFVPDFTFFSSGEVVATLGATPVFVDIEEDTFNINPNHLEQMIENVIAKGELIPKVIVCVDLFGQPADYDRVRMIADKYHLLILEDAAQGFGGRIGSRKACSFGDIATTSFFPAKPLGCYGDGGAVFTNNDNWADLLRSYRVHGKGSSKYDNVRIGMNSRLDTLQAAILLAKFPVFINEELEKEQMIARRYTEKLMGKVVTPTIRNGYYSSWAQYTIVLQTEEIRDKLQVFLREKGIPSMVYYSKAMHKQEAFKAFNYDDNEYAITNNMVNKVLSLPFHPYMDEKEIDEVSNTIIEFIRGH